MAIERWDPSREAVSLRDAMNALFQESFIRPGGPPAGGGPVGLPLDVRETADEFLITASLPGGVQAQVNVENLFGAHYFATANSDNNIAPGAPRSVKATLGYSF